MSNCTFDYIAFDAIAFDVCVPASPVVIEARRWPGPSYILWSDEFYFVQKQKRKKEDEEFIIL